MRNGGGDAQFIEHRIYREASPHHCVSKIKKHGLQESVFLQGTNRFAFESVLLVTMGIIQHKEGISQ